MDEKAIARFWLKVDSGRPGYKPGRCWPWTAGRFEEGYGAFRYRGKQRRAHRVMWELVHGPIPEGMFVCHTCDNPPCVNPTHLFLGTHQDNVTDKMAKGRYAPMAKERNPSWGVRKTQCKYGHELTGENVKVYRGVRQCVACAQRRTAAWNAKRSAERRARRGQGTQNTA